MKAQGRAAAGWHAIQHPLLVLIGTADEYVDPSAPPELFNACASGDKKLITYPGAYHELFNETPDVTALSDMVNWVDARLSDQAEPIRPKTTEPIVPSVYLADEKNLPTSYGSNLGLMLPPTPGQVNTPPSPSRSPRALLDGRQTGTGTSAKYAPENRGGSETMFKYDTGGTEEPPLYPRRSRTAL